MQQPDTSSSARGAPNSNLDISILSSQYRMTTIGIVSLVALIAFESLAVAAAMPTVAQALDALPLYALAFGITLATSVVGMTVAGGWCDARGPAIPLWSGLGCFGAGLLLAGCASNMPVFLAGRLIQGLGAGSMSVALYVLVGRRYPEGMHRRLFAAFATAWVIPSLVGPALSGFIAERLGWRWVFLSVPLLALPAASMLWPALRGLPGLYSGRTHSVRRSFWALGAATGICLLYLGGQQRDISAVSTLIVASALSLGCTWKLLPQGTLRAARGLPSVIALRGLSCSAFFGTEAFLPLMLTRERNLSPSMSGIVLSVGALGWCGASWYQGHSRNNWSRHHLLRIGSSAVCIGLAMTISVAWTATPVFLAVLGWIIAGLGMGLIYSSLSLLTLSMSEPGQQGTNASALQLCEAMAVAASLAVAGSLFSALLTTSAHAAYLANFAVMGIMAILAALIVGRTDTRQVFMN